MKWLALILSIAPLALPGQTRPGPERLKARVDEMLREDQDNPPSTEGVLFAGGDTVANWDLRRSFGQYRTIRRGLPGGTLADATFYADRLIVPFKPSTVVVESGDTGLALGLPPDAIVDQFKQFVAKIHKSLPKSVIVVLSVRPDASKPESASAARTINDAIHAIVASDKMMRFADLDTLLGADGKPDSSLLADGRQQLNKLGYELVTQVARKEVQRAEARYWRGYDPVDGQ